MPKARTFKKEQMRKSLTPSEEPEQKKGMDIALQFIQGLLSRAPSRLTNAQTPGTDDKVSTIDCDKSTSCVTHSDRSDSDQSGESADESDQSSDQQKSVAGDKLPDIHVDASEDGEGVFRVKKPRIKAARPRGDPPPLTGTSTADGVLRMTVFMS